jgi:hypothetical protein
MNSAATSQTRRSQVTAANGGLGFFGLLSFVGALVYFWADVSTVGGAVVAVLKALVWPAFLIYGLLHLSLG